MHLRASARLNPQKIEKRGVNSPTPTSGTTGTFPMVGTSCPHRVTGTFRTPTDRLAVRRVPTVVRALLAPALMVGIALLAVSPAGASDARAFTLGEAPIRFESQERAGWRTALKAGKTRDEVVALYNNTYLPGNSVALTWTGAIATCTAGTTNVAHQQATIDRVNYYRALVDLPPVTLLTGTPVTNSQASALMMSANGALSHTPPTSWLCYTAEGAAGAGSSNIALGIRGVGAIDGYMSDPGAGNTAVGHRRWILYPPRSGMATGDIPSVTGNWPANTLYVFGPTTTRPATPNGIAWPAAGFVPYQNLPSGSNRWSLSYPSANFSGATVTMTGPGGNIPVTLEPIANGYGDNTIVFKPAGFSYAKPAVDTTYTINVSGITGSGIPSSIQYTVTVIDPVPYYTLDLSPGPGGTVTASPNQASYAPGTVVTLTAIPDADYAFTGWSGDATGTAIPVQVTMNANRSVSAAFAPILVPTATVPPAASSGAGGTSPALVVPLVARTASFESEIFVTNPSAVPVNANVRFHGARGTSAAGLTTCAAQAVPAQSTVALSMASLCPSLPAGSQFGMLVIEDALQATALDAYTRTANPQGNGFSIEAYALGEFSPAPATVTGLKRVAVGPPPFQTNCFVAALGEPVDYQIVLTNGSSGAPIGSPVTGSLAAWETVRTLDIFGPAGANAPAGDYANVRADFSVPGATRGALLGYCTVQDNVSFGADFRLAKSVDAQDESQLRTVHVGHDGSGTLAEPAEIQDLGRRHVWLAAVRHPDSLSCSVAGPRSGDLEIRVREPGAVGATPVRAGGSGVASFALDADARASVNAGVAGYWAIEVSYREGANASLPIAYGLTCLAGNGMSIPMLVNPVGFADDF
jgi:hypothetical protein